MTEKVEKKIAILGTTPSRMEGPIDDPSWEVWTIGPGGKDAHRWDRLFEVHGTWPEDFNGYLNDLSLVKPPQQVLMLYPVREALALWGMKHGKTPEEVKKLVTGDWEAYQLYPRRLIEERFGRRMWFSSSISWCVALAMEEGATDIGCWGIDLESGEEYISQFVGCAHLLDVARDRGINVHLPKGCGLMRDPAPYPDRYETNLALAMERKKKMLQAMLAQLEPQFEQMRSLVSRKEGELLTLKQYQAPAEIAGKCEQELIEANQTLGNIVGNINHCKGELSATEYYWRMYVIGLNDPT